MADHASGNWRRVVQVQAPTWEASPWCILVALCEDGTLWKKNKFGTCEEGPWVQVQSPPQAEKQDDA